MREARTVVPGLLTTDGVDRFAAEYGEDSGFYQSRVLAEFAVESEDGVFRREWLEHAAKGWRDGEPDPDARRVFALDPAPIRPDVSVLAVRRGNRLEGFELWQGRIDTMELVERVRSELRERGVSLDQQSPRTETMRVDEVGLGAGVLDRLEELGYRVEGFNGRKQADEHELSFNRRAKAYWTLRQKLEAGEVDLPDGLPLFEELLALRWRSTPDRRFQLERKEDVKSRLGRSPDRADATAMLWAPTKGPAAGLTDLGQKVESEVVGAWQKSHGAEGDETVHGP